MRNFSAKGFVTYGSWLTERQRMSVWAVSITETLKRRSYLGSIAILSFGELSDPYLDVPGC